MESFAEIATLWLDDVRRTRRPKTVQSYGIALQKFTECVPDARTRFVTRADLVKFRDWRADTTSVLSANRDLKALRACLNWAWVNELPHPTVQLRRLLLAPPPRKDETLTPGEVERVMAAAGIRCPHSCGTEDLSCDRHAPR